MPRRFTPTPLVLLLSAAFGSLANTAALSACTADGSGLITIPTGSSQPTCTMAAGNSIQVNGPIAPAFTSPYGIYAGPGTPIGYINIAAGGVVQVGLSGSSTQNGIAVSINGPTMDSFTNSGMVYTTGFSGSLFLTGVGIANTAIAQDFTNLGSIQNGNGVAVMLNNSTIGGDFRNGATGTINNTPTASATSPTIIELNNVTIGGDFVNEGTIRAYVAANRSVIQLTGSTVHGAVTNTGTISDLNLNNSSVASGIANTGVARQIAVTSGSTVESVRNGVGGSLQGFLLDGSTVTNGVVNNGQIASADTTIAGIELNNGVVQNNGIVNGSTGTIGNRRGIVARGASQVGGGIENAGTIQGSLDAISVLEGSTVTGTIINTGTIWSTGGIGITVDASTVNGTIRNDGLLSGIKAIAIRNGGTIDGDIVNNSTLSGSYGTGVGMEVSGASTVTGRIANTGTISSGVVVDGATVIGGISNTGTIGAKADGAAVDVSNAAVPLTITNAGTIDGVIRLGASTLDIEGGNVTGAINGIGGTVNINTDYTPSSTITVQRVNVAAGKTLTVANQEIKGLMSVAGTLAGSGDVGPTTLLGGAVLSPGTSATPVGSLTVNGDLVFNSGSTYRVDAAPDGTHDTVHATGIAKLAGTVLQVGSNGTYTPSTAYTIVTADSGLQGQFATVSSNLAYLAPTVAYDGNNVVMRVDLKTVPVDPGTPPSDGGTGGNPGAGNGTGGNAGGSGGGVRPIRFADLAFTGNQRAAANALQSLPANSSLYTRVLNLPNGAPAGVFSDLAGESHVSTVSAMQNVTNNVVSLPMAHLHANLNAGWLPGPPTAQLNMGDASTLPRSAAQPMWAQVFGNWRTMDGNGNAARTKETDGGLFVGGDYGIGNGWRLGGALGYTDSHIAVDDHSASSDVSSYSAVVYGGKAFQAGPGKINLTAGAAYTWHDIKSERNVNAAGQYQNLTASYSANTSQVFTEVGYAMPLTDRITLEPFVGADFSDLRTRGFSESGGDAALNGASNRNRVGTTTLGLHAQTTFELNQAAGRLRGTVGWRHAYGDVNPETTMSFDGSQSFTVAGAPIARDAAVVELGVDMAMNKYATIGLSYAGQFGNGNRQNTGSVNLSWRF
ncbi:autotransporter domain-containing protein [Bordetella bronchialis]|uniref:autotransporter family protein n=1 Tax=Bordetella bronchialis TaxID=463025 RepID=UPI003D01D7F7